MQGWQLRMFRRMLPAMLIGVVEMLALLFLAYRAFIGKGMALPFLKNIAANYVK